MADAVIVDAVRTPIGKRGGSLSDTHSADLSATVLRALIERTGLEPSLIDDVIWGCVGQVGDQSFNIARVAVLSAGWPETVPATTVDRQCGSSQQSVHFAAAGLISGQYDFVVAGGVENMTRIPMGATASSAHTGAHNEPFGPTFFARYHRRPHQGLGAEMVAQRWALSRQQLDEFAMQSHERAATATDSGAFTDELAPVMLPDGSRFAADEGIRRNGTLQTLGALRPAFDPDNGKITAGNSSQISDGAAALLLTTSATAAAHGLRPLARIHTAVVAADDPIIMLTAPIPATEAALKKSGLRIDDIGAVEVNEAFASVPLAWLAETGAEPAALNPNGGAIALGHPLGGSGARLMTTLVHHMRRHDIRYGLQTMCEGGGMANATILERL
ncbi:thiolase family protein [Mycobacterium arosiense]|uniref:Acetyl-CoA acetyltransferase n=1 Tax=Mycobacterium arosiense ATCC BAA-1401 = DSM 45069 TaxID=1265311 RepID=A0A1W9ZBX0_MYCAI|nr:thiolase family protein [Mycobacterium arosiense]ORA11665.1 acetyl-CoA acetyltransferase [Mycobacterium arosiense ATCC BAA-1401 = DSM 45069]